MLDIALFRKLTSVFVNANHKIKPDYREQEFIN